MYVVTFYSYKGGVGRTMSLANVAAELAQRGRKVLIVDFDLEAPGIATFDFCKAHSGADGIVDYIGEYSRTLEAPKIDAYLQRCDLPCSGKEASIWIMSAGRQDDQYKSKFHSINWDHLYSEQSGYLMIENLKEQWKDALNPDYVFIDSRTGYTDISGICTRQLPDAVVFTFFPNAQNLTGLTQVVNEVRLEASTSREKTILTHFVASNIPDVDDEEGILRDHLEEFGKVLGYDEHNVIHYYSSLSIMNQEIFTLTRRNTKLAREYLQLTNQIIRSNPADRDGALAYVESILAKFKNDRKNIGSLDAVIKRMAAIKDAHPKDGKVFSALAELYSQMGRNAEAIVEYEEAMVSDYDTVDVLRNLAALYREENRDSDAVLMLHKLLAKATADADVYFGFLYLLDLDESSIPRVLEQENIKNLEPSSLSVIASILRSRRSMLPYALPILLSLEANESLDSKERASVKYQLLMSQIASGHFADALARFGSREEMATSNLISDVFNYAMAEWGLTKVAPPDLLQHVLGLDEKNKSASRTEDANYTQCLALASYLVGSTEDAFGWLARSRDIATKKHNQAREFSCWSYLYITVGEFTDDLEKMRAMFNGDDILPAFMTERHSSSIN